MSVQGASTDIAGPAGQADASGQDTAATAANDEPAATETAPSSPTPAPATTAAAPAKPAIANPEAKPSTQVRSEERRGGKECVSKCRSRGAPDNSQKKRKKRQ